MQKLNLKGFPARRKGSEARGDGLVGLGFRASLCNIERLHRQEILHHLAGLVASSVMSDKGS